jgi:hypothetical protein
MLGEQARRIQCRRVHRHHGKVFGDIACVHALRILRLTVRAGGGPVGP